MQGDVLRLWILRSFLVLIAAWLSASASAEDNFAGSYTLSGVTQDNARYSGDVGIARQGFAYDVTWRFDDRAPQKGFALTLNHVLGVAYWPDSVEQEASLGIVIYQIDGGTLDGIWLPMGAAKHMPGREVLSGSPDLTGRYQIALGVNPGGRSNYTGYADFERTGDHIKIVWHAPRQVFLGTGIKMGTMLIVAYAYEHFPAIAAYCANGHSLQGIWWSGPDGDSGRETLTPVVPGGAQLSGTGSANPLDPCNTPIAANF